MVCSVAAVKTERGSNAGVVGIFKYVLLSAEPSLTGTK